MTQLEQIQRACDALKEKMGEKAVVEVIVRAKGSVQIFVRPKGWDGDWVIITHGEPIAGLAWVEAEWEAKRAEVDTQLTKAIALAIIRLTHEFGACTDAQLRGDFDARDVDRLGVAAVELANTMAERGPFSIEVAGGANDRSAA